MNYRETAAKLAVLSKQVDALNEQIKQLRYDLLLGEIYVLPLAFSYEGLLYHDHVHNRAGRCVKNRYGDRCENV